ncbi:hypothetical protein GCM10027053_21340 [Intrasporangium mesophilum]
MGFRRGVPLRDRPLAGPGAPKQAVARQRHCWVEGPDDHPGPWPGVVVEWRRDPGTSDWTALVVYVVTDGLRSTTVQTWLSARYLRPLDGS